MLLETSHPEEVNKGGCYKDASEGWCWLASVTNFKRWSTVHKRMRKRQPRVGEQQMCVHLCGTVVGKGAEEKVEALISACSTLENILATGPFNSSRLVSLPRHPSPLNRIDYWFLLSSPALLSIRPYFQLRERGWGGMCGRGSVSTYGVYACVCVSVCDFMIEIVLRRR